MPYKALGLHKGRKARNARNARARTRVSKALLLAPKAQIGLSTLNSQPSTAASGRAAK